VPDTAAGTVGDDPHAGATLETERSNLVRAIAVGGDLDDLVEALRVREQRRQELEGELRACRPRPAMSDVQVRHMRIAMGHGERLRAFTTGTPLSNAATAPRICRVNQCVSATGHDF
jgi:hypothetical protein